MLRRSRLVFLRRPLARRTLGWALVATVSLLVAQLGFPAAILFASASRSTLALAMLGGSLLLSFVRGFAAERTSAAVRGAIYDTIADAVDALPAPRDGTPIPGRIETTVARGGVYIEAFFATTLPALVANAVALPITVTLVAATLGARAAVVAATGLTVGAALGVAASRFAARVNDQSWEQFAPLAALVERGLRSRAEVRANGLSERFRRSLTDRVTAWSRFERRAYWSSTLANRAVPVAAVVAFYAISRATGIVGADFDPARMFAPSRSTVVGALLAATLVPTLSGLSSALSMLSQEWTYLRSIAVLVRGMAPSIGSPAESNRPLGDFVVAHARFSYENAAERPIGADFTWRVGESLALVGPTGCGKTTVAHLVMGLLEPSSGVIEARYDDGSPAPRVARGRFAYLAQHVYFDEEESIERAFRFFAPTASLDEIRGLLARLFPDGPPSLDRRLSELSGGQRRLVALARVLLARAELVVLDEPEASLDAESQQRVFELLAEQMRARRLLVLTHRSELARLADRILSFGPERVAAEVGMDASGVHERRAAGAVR